MICGTAKGVLSSSDVMYLCVNGVPFTVFQEACGVIHSISVLHCASSIPT